MNILVAMKWVNGEACSHRLHLQWGWGEHVPTVCEVSNFVPVTF